MTPGTRTELVRDIGWHQAGQRSWESGTGTSEIDRLGCWARPVRSDQTGEEHGQRPAGLAEGGTGISNGAAAGAVVSHGGCWKHWSGQGRATVTAPKRSPAAEEPKRRQEVEPEKPWPFFCIAPGCPQKHDLPAVISSGKCLWSIGFQSGRP
jgi:hypothetical protein